MPNNEPKRARVIRAAQSTQNPNPSASPSMHQNNSEPLFRRPSQITNSFQNLNFQNGDMSPIVPSPRQLPLNEHPPIGKILLPPLHGPQVARSGSKGTEKSRTSHACDKCRRAKAKCSGGVPCEKCKNEGKECVYGAGKRDREKLELDRANNLCKIMTERNNQLIELLQRLGDSGELSPDKVEEIRDVVAKPPSPLSDDYDDGTPFSAQRSGYRRTESYDDSSGERDADGDVGSTGSLDATNIDTNQTEETRADGFIGKSSSVNWVQRAKNETANERSGLQLDVMKGLTTEKTLSVSNYMTNNTDQGGIEDISVNPYEMPPPDVADALVDSYFEDVHMARPFFLKMDFMEAFKTFPREPNAILSSKDETWLCLINLVFAIGARLAHLTNADYQGDERDDLLYFARAKRLGLDDEQLLYKDSELQKTTCLGLLVIYLMASNQLNRAWIIIGLAVRHATSLGLHVRNEAKTLTDVDKEVQIRVWWSLYSLERQLNALTGRPSCISINDTSTPLPLNLDEQTFDRSVPLNQSLRPSMSREHSTDSIYVTKGEKPDISQRKRSPTTEKSRSTMYSDPTSRRTSVTRSSHNTTPSTGYTLPGEKLAFTSSTFFIYSIQLSMIHHRILVQLYSATTGDQKWSDIQNRIRALDRRLEVWKLTLPVELDFSTKSDDQYAPQRLGLEMFFNSSRMMLFRPCLCRFEGRIPHESQKSKTFNQDAVRSCVDSARAVIGSFSDEPDPVEIYKISAWWNALHYLCEAAALLMLEIAFRAQHMPSEVDDIFHDAKKAVRWLYTLSETSISARKGWEIFDRLLRDVAPLIGQSTDDLETQAPMPPNWRHKRLSVTPSGPIIKNSDPLPSASESQPSTYEAPVQFFGMPPHDLTNDWVQHGQFNDNQEFLLSPYTPVTTNYLQSLSLVTTAGNHYGRYDEFGPWHNSFGRDSYFVTAPNADSFSVPHNAPHMTIRNQDLAFQDLGTTPDINSVTAPMELGTSDMPGREAHTGFTTPPDWYIPMGMYPDQC